MRKCQQKSDSVSQCYGNLKNKKFRKIRFVNTASLWLILSMWPLGWKIPDPVIQEK